MKHKKRDNERKTQDGLSPAILQVLRQHCPEGTLPDGTPVHVVLSGLGSDFYLANDGSVLVDMYFDEPDFQSSIRKASLEEVWKALRILGRRPEMSVLLTALPIAPQGSQDCKECLASGWKHIDGIQVDLVCFTCHGIGWTP